MPSAEERLAAKGRREPTAGLLQQAERSLGLAALHRRELEAHGFSAEHLRELTDLAAGLAAEARSLLADWDGALAALREEAMALDGARAFAFKLAKAAPLALREAETDLTADDFAAGELERSLPRLLEHLERVRPRVRRLDRALQPYFRGESALMILDAVKYGLEAALKAREAAPPESPAPVEVRKGRLLELLEDLHRVAAIAFHGRSELAARFNDDLLVRARRSRSGRVEGEPETAERVAGRR